MPSRKLTDLDPRMALLTKELTAECAKVGIDLLVTCTYRSNDEQAAAYAQGRTAPGPIVTNAKPGTSKHNVVNAAGKPASRAIDVVPLRHSKPVWDGKDPVWAVVGAIGHRLGLEWAGTWVTMRELAHFQLKEGVK